MIFTRKFGFRDNHGPKTRISFYRKTTNRTSLENISRPSRKNEQLTVCVEKLEKMKNEDHEVNMEKYFASGEKRKSGNWAKEQFHIKVLV